MDEEKSKQVALAQNNCFDLAIFALFAEAGKRHSKA
jgi:hypothetical protein